MILKNRKLNSEILKTRELNSEILKKKKQRRPECLGTASEVHKREDK